MSQKIVRTIDSIYTTLYTQPSMQTIRIENAATRNGDILQGYSNGRLVTYKASYTNDVCFRYVDVYRT